MCGAARLRRLCTSAYMTAGGFAAVFAVALVAAAAAAAACEMSERLEMSER